MFETFRDFIKADSQDAAFLLIYVSVLALLLAASAIFGALVPKREGPKSVARAELSPMQRRARAAAFGFSGWIARLDITANQVTAIGLLLVVVNCAFFVWHRDTFIFGLGLIAAFLFDTLDGAVARAQNSASKWGGYLDAVIDRYQEVVTLLAVGWVTSMWLPVFLVMTGSMMTSYNKARAAIEVPIDNKGWPDLLAKPSRTFFLVTAMIGNNTLPWLLEAGLWSLAAMTHLTALHRMGRAYFIMQSQSGGGRQSG